MQWEFENVGVGVVNVSILMYKLIYKNGSSSGELHAVILCTEMISAHQHPHRVGAFQPRGMRAVLSSVFRIWIQGLACYTVIHIVLDIYYI